MVADFKTAFGHYRIEDEIYNGRKARVLYAGDKLVAQSGLARDDNEELLFDYNQRFLELAAGMNPDRVLVLGGGVLTLPTALVRKLPGVHVDVVERDAKLIELAQKYFEYQPNEHLVVYIGDGVEFLASTRAKYDLIIMDVFDEARIPPGFQTPAFMRVAQKHLRVHGLIAINCIASLQGRNSLVLHSLHDLLTATFRAVKIYAASRDASEWMTENYLILGQDGSWNPSPSLLRLPVRLPTKL